jgi:hypothetical protein
MGDPMNAEDIERMVREAARTGDASDLAANGIDIEKAEHGIRWKRIEGAE